LEKAIATSKGLAESSRKVDANAVDGRKGMKVQYLTVMNRREYF
jgi:ethanolamine utilization protein EutQ (cupin superfamily)